MASKLSLNCGTFTDAGSVYFIFGDKNDDKFTTKLSCLIDANNIPGTLINSYSRAPKTQDIIISLPTLTSLFDDRPGFSLKNSNLYKIFYKPSSDINRVNEVYFDFYTNVQGLSRRYHYNPSDPVYKRKMLIARAVYFGLNIAMYSIFIVKFVFGLSIMLKA